MHAALLPLLAVLAAASPLVSRAHEPEDSKFPPLVPPNDRCKDVCSNTWFEDTYKKCSERKDVNGTSPFDCIEWCPGSIHNVDKPGYRKITTKEEEVGGAAYFNCTMCNTHVSDDDMYKPATDDHSYAYLVYWESIVGSSCKGWGGKAFNADAPIYGDPWGNTTAQVGNTHEAVANNFIPTPGNVRYNANGTSNGTTDGNSTDSNSNSSDSGPSNTGASNSTNNGTGSDNKDKKDNGASALAPGALVAVAALAGLLVL